MGSSYDSSSLSSEQLVESCLASSSGNDNNNNMANALLCITDALRTENLNNINNLSNGIDDFFLIYAGSLIVFMQGGFAMLCAGSVRKKNVVNTMMKNLLDACGAGAAYFICGYAFCYGGTNGIITNEDSLQTTSSFIGTENFFLIDVPSYSFWFQQFAFSATAATIVAGTLAERSQMTAYFYYSLLLSGFVFPIVARQVWTVDGFLNANKASRLFGSGVIDFAGSIVVHCTGGITALIASLILGPRRDRFIDESTGNPLKNPKRVQGYSVGLQVLGTFILWFGWYGFNAGSVQMVSNLNNPDGSVIASLATVNTTLGASFGAITALFVDAFMNKRLTGELHLDMTRALNGCLTGLVSITAGCSVMEPWAGCLIGSFGGLIYLWSIHILNYWKIDDAVEAINVHLFGGILGAIAPGLLASPRYMLSVYGHDDYVGWFYEWGRGQANAHLLAANLIGLLFVFGFVTLIMGPFFLILNCFGLFRSDPLEEIVGLDVHYSGHGDDTATGGGGMVKPEHLQALREQMNKRRIIAQQQEEQQQQGDGSVDEGLDQEDLEQ